MTSTPDAPAVGALSGLFESTFGSAPDGVWQAPGRVNLIGEHTDYNEGFVLPFAIDKTAKVAVRIRHDSRVRLLSTFGGQGLVEADVDALVPEAAKGWTKYPLGVAWALQQRGVLVPGFDLLMDSDVPLGAGLSSSHAIECAVISALNELTGAGLGAEDMVLATQRAENDFVGAPTGIMDQSASLRGSKGHAVFLDCRDQSVQLVPFDAQEAGLVLLVIDTKVSHSHADGGYASRRASCELGAQVLGVPALRDVGIGDLEEASGLLDSTTFRRVRHIVTENDRVLQTVERLTTEGPAHIGRLLDASHASMRDDFEISCPELDLAVETSRAHGAIGARMTGGGFGGSAIALTPVGHEQEVRDAVVRAFAAAGFTTPDIFTVTPAAGATRLA
ncbi:galactokinase [Arthrobacter bambusae]|jgi:galactokinase|uniref:Galactokinase n=1 Tax=Arthrobacter bambusae TaxID=1338426 RepID=A0AAW8DA56_9MICC|nr:galactokinase [Arthrobacter bambusae]MDP9905182.1 galactokinase [Arthrobacter bambusae]MDQ0132058.1 galactokinase [Arthrobacter bambusae]MDQ0180314.1 galactokinase [Arthrobacter bambusae]MDQ0238419.1 galactokinase [Arthrobacter bambusae]